MSANYPLLAQPSVGADVIRGAVIFIFGNYFHIRSNSRIDTSHDV